MEEQERLQDTQKNNLLNARLSEAEKQKLYQFNSDEAMVNAVEKVLTYTLYMMGTIAPEDKEIYDVNWAFGLHRPGQTDEELGRELNKRLVGLSYLEDAFRQIKKIKLVESKKAEVQNPAR